MGRRLPVQRVKQGDFDSSGIARMSFVKFGLYTVVAIIPWSILFLYLGMTLGTKWEQINQVAKPYVTQAIMIVILFTIGYVVYKWKWKKTEKR
jgi:membrane protein DedA with SNARE-associated domain